MIVNLLNRIKIAQSNILRNFKLKDTIFDKLL
jgi:hypothetical protein